MTARPTPCLLGPTASGKSEVAWALARATRGEIVAVDAFTAYRGLEILTAAPEAPGDVPHHLIGHLSPAEGWSAAAFVEACDRLVDEIFARGGTPWLVGGSALYLRSWLKGFGAPVPRDSIYREALQREAAANGSRVLHARLREIDPERAAAVHPNDVRRIIRALEIIRATGRPASAQRGEWDGPDRRRALVFGLRRERADLERRIERRAAEMFEAGVVEEARRALSSDLSPEAAKVLGLDVLARLLAGEIDRDEARAEIARKTRRFARKQHTFFASFAGVVWIDVAADEAPEAVAATVLEAYRGSTSA